MVYDALGDLLLAADASTAVQLAGDTTTAVGAKPTTPVSYISVKLLINTLTQVYGSIRDHLVHEEVLVSWGELVDMCVHCFPSVGQHVRDSQTVWEIGQHCIHDTNGTRYHYWGTDTGYNHTSRNGSRRRRDMVRAGLNGEHLAEIVCFVRVLLPAPPSSGDATRPEVGFLPDMFTWCVYLTCLPDMFSWCP